MKTEIRGMTREKKIERAVIYTRVASRAASDHESQHAEQERQCREHAEANGYVVVAAFRDDISASTAERPGMKALLGFLREGGKCRVIVTDVTRLSRDIGLVMELMAAIIKADGSLDFVMHGERRPTKEQFESFLTWAVRKYKERKSASVKH